MSSAEEDVRRYGECMKIRCAVFDFDGTLFDSMSIWEHAGERYLKTLGRTAKSTLREDLRPLSLYQSACFLKQEYDLSLTAEQIMEGVNQMIEDFYLYEVQPKTGVIDFLKKLEKEGVSMCIATASERYHIEAALERCRMTVYFDRIFTCSEVGHGKDEPFIFRKAMEYYATDRKATYIFEDALHAIRTAKADGYTVVAVYDSSEKRQPQIQEMSDYYLSDFVNTEPFWKQVSDV